MSSPAGCEYHAGLSSTLPPTPLTYSELLRGCRDAALAVQGSKDHSVQSLGEEPSDVAYDYWRDATVDKRNMRQGQVWTQAAPGEQGLERRCEVGYRCFVPVL